MCLFHIETRWFTDELRGAEVKQEVIKWECLFHIETRWFTDEPRCAEVRQEAVVLLLNAVFASLNCRGFLTSRQKSVAS